MTSATGASKTRAFARAVERSSFGTPGAAALRRTTPKATVSQIVRRAGEISKARR